MRSSRKMEYTMQTYYDFKNQIKIICMCITILKEVSYARSCIYLIKNTVKYYYNLK